MKDTTPPANRAETPQVKPKTETWWAVRMAGRNLSPNEYLFYDNQLTAQAEVDYRLRVTLYAYQVVKVTVEPVKPPDA